MNAFVISGLPMPPSLNQLWRRRSMRRGGSGLMRSEAYDNYLAEMEAWSWEHLVLLGRARQRLQQWKAQDPGMRLQVNVQFRFHQKAILTKDGRPKRNDTENRLKALFDALAAALQVDDSLFWEGSFSKASAPPGEPENASVTLVLLPPLQAAAPEPQASPELLEKAQAPVAS